MRIAIFSFIASLILFIAAATANSHSEPLSARSLDALLQARALESLSRRRARTGVVIPARIPNSLAGIVAAAVRLRSGSLRARGLKVFGEFRIPIGVTEQPYAKRVALVYHNLGNLSSQFYPLPGFDYLAPVLGLIAYDATNLTAVDSPELELLNAGDPIAARFGGSDLPGSALCVFFDLHGSVQFDRPVRGNWCEMVRQGHVAVAVESAAPSPAPEAPPEMDRRRRGGRAGTIAGCLAAAIVVLAGIVLFWLRFRVSRGEARDKSEEWESGERAGESLEVTSFGGIKAPFARVTRTQPVLEDRYVP